MIQVEDKIISLDIFEKHFVCDLNACKGACCIEGDAGAPLLDEEERILEDIYEKVRCKISLNHSNPDFGGINSREKLENIIKINPIIQVIEWNNSGHNIHRDFPVEFSEGLLSYIEK